MKNTFETIIIGAGISGLACARKLYENKKEFLVISEDIGGRILTSEDGRVNYGAQYILGDYHHVKRFVKIGRKMSLKDLLFHENNETYTFSIWNKKVITPLKETSGEISINNKKISENSINGFTHLFQVIRFLFLLYKFRRHYNVFKKKCESVSQAQALKSDPFLIRSYNQNASDFLKEYNFKDIVEYYFAMISRGFTFLPFNRLKAFTFLHLFLFVINSGYEFIFLKDEMIKNFKKDIIIDTVIQITKKKNVYCVKTNKRILQAKNVVVATPPHVSKKLLHIKKMNKPVKAHMFHLSGILRESFKNYEGNIFSDDNNILGLIRLRDGSFLLYARVRNPKFEECFYEYNIIKHRYWNPAFNLDGNVLLECEQDKNLYLIGDHNETCLEDAYIGGIYAANRILDKK